MRSTVSSYDRAPSSATKIYNSGMGERTFLGSFLTWGPFLSFPPIFDAARTHKSHPTELRMRQKPGLG